jgi:hypothetical protein
MNRTLFPRRYPDGFMPISEAVVEAEHACFIDEIEEGTKAGLDTTEYTRIVWKALKKLMEEGKIYAYLPQR